MSSVFLRIAEQVLRQRGTPLSARQIIAIAEAQQLLPDNLSGATPHQTLKSKLSVSIRTEGERSRFVRTSPGRFFLRELLEPGVPIYDAPPLRPPKTAEHVLVIPAATLDQLGRFQGIRVRWKTFLRRLLASDFRTLDRYAAEVDDEHKQIVTYVMVTRGDAVLAYRRGAFNRAEHFLRGADCVGFGGHVTGTDRNLLSERDHGVSQAAIRELSEELSLPDSDIRRLAAGEGLQVVGLLNDDTSPAGRRHFALIFRYEVSADDSGSCPERGEKAITQLRWLTPGSSFSLNEFEYWSQLCLRAYFPEMAEGQPSARIRRVTPFKPPHAICVVGQIGSGKTEAAELFQEQFGYTVVNSGEVLAGILERAAVTEATRAEFQDAAEAFISEPDGPDILARAIADEVRASGNERVCIDGLRQLATFDALRQHAGRRVAMLYVHAPPDVAYEFYKARSGQEHSVLEFAAAREAKVELDVEHLIAVADAVLFNWYGRSAYRRAVRELFTELPTRIEV